MASSSLRSRILSDHVQHLSLSHHSDALEAALCNQAFDHSWPSEQANPLLPGGLTREDLLRFETLPTVPPELEDLLTEELDNTFCSLCDLFYAHSEDGEETEHSPTQLLHDILALKSASSDVHKEVEEQRERMLTLVSQINDIHPRLEFHLLKALSSPSANTNADPDTPTDIPSKTNAQLSSRVSLLAASIDTTLLRLQLLRTRFEESLYNFSAPPSKSKSGTTSVPKGTHTRGTGQSRTFAEALQSSSQKLSEEESRLAAEEEELDRKLAEYEDLLDIVDRDRSIGKERKRTVSNRDDGSRRERPERGGRNNTFDQVVDDWARVKKETEECVRDLRRLGWAEG